MDRTVMALDKQGRVLVKPHFYFAHEIDGRIRALEHNLKQASDSAAYWRGKCAVMRLELSIELSRKQTCRRRLQPVVRWLMEL